MLQNYNKWRVLGVFFDNPLPEEGGFQLRELSREANLAPASVKRYLKELEAEGLIKETKQRVQGFPLYSANWEDERFLFYKKINNLVALAESGVISLINDECLPNAIVLFGSAAKGEDVKGSDIDLFVQSTPKKIGLDKFEKKLGRHISLLFAGNLNELSEELRNNIINGVKLKGYLKVF